MASMLRFARACAVFTGAAAALVVAAAPAGAEAASGTVDRGADVAGFTVDVGDDELAELGTSLIGFELSDGTVLGMYCVEIRTEINEESELVEQPWDAFPAEDTPFNENQEKINWVLHNGFPVVEPDALTEVLAEAGVDANDGIDETEAITATQAAVWHFSDGVDLNREDPLPGDDSDDAAAQDVLALYDFLTGDENTGVEEKPAAALEISPDDLAGLAGEKIGPFTVKTNGQIAELATELPESVRITDADGNELAAEQVKNGTELFVDVPAGTVDGAASFEVAAMAEVNTGRLFVAENYDEQPSQALIVAKADQTQLVASANASWTQEEVAPVAQAKNDDDSLASTGASIFAPILLGIVLIGAGVFSVMFVRNRRRV